MGARLVYTSRGGTCAAGMSLNVQSRQGRVSEREDRCGHRSGDRKTGALRWRGENLAGTRDCCRRTRLAGHDAVMRAMAPAACRKTCLFAAWHYRGKRTQPEKQNEKEREPTSHLTLMLHELAPQDSCFESTTAKPSQVHQVIPRVRQVSSGHYIFSDAPMRGMPCPK